MIGKILLNNAVSIGIHGVLCLLSFFIIVTLGLQFRIKSPYFFMIFYTIIVFSLYCLSGRFILRNTHGVWTSLLSVTLLAVIVTVAMLAARSRSSLVVMNMSFFPLIDAFHYLPLPRFISETKSLGLSFLCLIACLPSLAMWIGMISARTKL